MAGPCSIKAEGCQLSKGGHTEMWRQIKEMSEQYKSMRMQLAELSTQVAELIIQLKLYEPRPEGKDNHKKPVNKTEGTSKAKKSTGAQISLQEYEDCNHASINARASHRESPHNHGPTTLSKMATRRSGRIKCSQENHSARISSQEQVWAAMRRVLKRT